MNARTMLAATALGRLAIGAGLTSSPAKTFGPDWLGSDESARPASTVLFRAVGARDMALALGTLGALRTGAKLRPWLLTATLADAVDLFATIAGGRAVPVRGRATIALVAGGAVATQLRLARTLD
jgi:hypothetical protein